MIAYMGVAEVVGLLKKHGVAPIIERIAGYIRDDYLRWDAFDKCARVASHSRNGVIELMPTADASLYSFKYVNGHPGNTRARKLTVMAFGMLADVADGRPLLLAELTLTTALRTAATSALAAAAMARPGSRTMALIGNGSQSEFQALALHRMLGIDEIRAYDTDPRATAKLLRNLANVDGLRVRAAGSIADAVQGADIVTTITACKSHETVLLPAMIEPGMHINAVGGDSPGKTELHPDIVRDARVVVEFEPQTRIEGEIQQMAPDFPVIPLWQVLANQVAGRTGESDVTLFDSVGFALEDFSALRFLYDSCRGPKPLLTPRSIDLVPEIGDPKDLFSLTRAGEPEHERASDEDAEQARVALAV